MSAPRRELARRRLGAFTLIELMIVVAIIGVLAAIAIPAFVLYVRRSKTTEATMNLSSMFKSASAYYAAERTSKSVGAPTTTNCTVPSESINPSTVGAEKQRFEKLLSPNMTALGFSVSEYVYYGYGITSVGGCQRSANDQSVYTFYAIGDLDGDSTTSLFELAVGTDDSNQLYHARGFYVVNETE